MTLPSTRVLYRLLTAAYALGLFLTYLFGVSGYVYYIYAPNSTALTLVPLGLTVLLLCGQVLVAMREETAVGRSKIKPSRAWVAFLLVYVMVTWFAFQLSHLRLQ